MKAVVVFLVLVLLGLGIMMIDSWLLSDSPTHVIRVPPAASAKSK
jgi:hypothetical protein